MESKFISDEICYTGHQLAPHWIYKTFDLQGDAIVGFIGESNVKIDEMVDISDVLSNSPIYSKKMIHFIVEHFNINLVEGVLRQRLLVNIAKDVISLYLPDSDKIIRKGDDLFYNKGKLSVSIATKSLTSILIHLGINIDATGAPVKASGITSEMKLENVTEIANNIIKNYCLENDQILKASCKVRGVI